MNFKHRGWKTISARARGIKRNLSLGESAWKGAAYFLLAVAGVVWFGTLIGSSPGSVHSWLVNMGLAVIIGALAFLLGKLIVDLLSKFQNIPLLYRWAFVGTVFLLFNLLKPSVLLMPNVVGILVLLVAASSLAGAGIGALREGSLGTVTHRVALGMLLFGGLSLVLSASWFFWAGPNYRLPEFAVETPADFALREMENPADQGPYTVKTLTYGSGVDKWRLEYGREADILTGRVDISSMVKGKGGVSGRLRNRFWGFDLTEVPLNGRVWYPEGSGPFPLVLMVHGNHAMDDFSDAGYGYLGELLASRGYIFASVDQNFLNGAGFVEVILGGMEEENDARGYLLLKHLDLWQRWNAREGHIFHNRVDTDHIGLIGHSRGGEAAAIAAAFHRLPAHPDDAALRFDFDFRIRAVAAVAPSDGQYKPRKNFTSLENISYLVLQGAADADVRSFSGASQYDRVSFTDGEEHFKACVYVYGANHGQFNTDWGRVDLPSALWFLNRGDIMPAGEQEKVAGVFLSGFLEAALKGQEEYRKLFYNPSFKKDWLPPGIYLSQYSDSLTLNLACFEEDLNLETATWPGGRLEGKDLTTWREKPPTMGSSRLRDSVGVRIGWDREQFAAPSYCLTLPEDFTMDPDKAGLLRFAAANVSKSREPLDFTVMITDREGEKAYLPLNSILPLPPALQYRIFKPPLLVSFESEPVYTTYTFSLSDFVSENTSLDPGQLAQISFLFDRSPQGDIFLDDISLR